MTSAKIEKGDWITSNIGLPIPTLGVPIGQVIGDGIMAKQPAYLINIGGGRKSAVLKDSAILLHKNLKSIEEE